MSRFYARVAARPPARWKALRRLPAGVAGCEQRLLRAIKSRLFRAELCAAAILLRRPYHRLPSSRRVPGEGVAA